MRHESMIRRELQLLRAGLKATRPSPQRHAEILAAIRALQWALGHDLPGPHALLPEREWNAAREWTAAPPTYPAHYG